MIEIMLVFVGAVLAVGSCVLEIAPAVKTGPVFIKLCLAVMCFAGVILINAAL